MRVEEGVPEDRNDKRRNSHEAAPETAGMNKTSSAGESAKKRSTSGLLDEEASADEDEDEDDCRQGGSPPPVTDTPRSVDEALLVGEGPPL